MSETTEVRYEVTLRGRGIRKRCRNRDEFFLPLGYTARLEVAGDVEQKARERLAAGFREVNAARVAVMEVRYTDYGDGRSCTAFSIDSPRVEKVLV